MTKIENLTNAPKKRIHSIDALRGFALLGIIMVHCMEHFDLISVPVLESPFWQWIDNAVSSAIYFIFQGKAYAIFSLLFGLSFFIQMDSQADKGVDFRFRFLWRLMLLLGLGYLNGMVYMGEFFVVYAVLGIVLIPLYKVPSKYLIILSVLLFMQIPGIMQFVSLLSNNAVNTPSEMNIRMESLFEQSAYVFTNGSVWDVLSFNAFKGQSAKLLWVFIHLRYLQLIGLFIVGLLIGRSGIHKDEAKMVKYGKRVLPYAVGVFAFFYGIVLLLPHMGVSGFALENGETLFKSYGNLGMMVTYICLFTILYHKRDWARKLLEKLAPVGRMSVTNYMVQSFLGVIIFYGFGLNCAVRSFLECALIGIGLGAFQIAYSNWWIKRFYYGPMEWLWRTLTFFKRVPLRRQEAKPLVPACETR